MSVTEEHLPKNYNNNDSDDNIEVNTSSTKIHRYACDINQDWPTESNLSSSSPTNKNIGPIIKDDVPRSMYYNSDDDDDDCLCTCSCFRCECCPNVSDWCIRDPFGLSCSFTTWFLFIYAQFVIIFVILIPKTHSTLFNLINLLIFHTLEILAVSSHIKTMFTNPV